MRADWVRGDPDDERLHEVHGDDDRVLDLDKLWHGVHFLLTGEAEADDSDLGLAVLGGVEVGPDLGHGPARRLEAHEVEAVADALDAVDFDVLREEFDPEAFAQSGVHPDLWHEPDVVDELIDAVRRLAAFYRSAADAGQDVVIRIT